MIELRGDLGAGKTRLVQGIAKGVGIQDHIPSPTFTLSRTYPLSDDRSLHHFDFYRVVNRDVVTEALEEVTNDPKAIVVTEWAENGKGLLPDDRLTIVMDYLEDSDSRSIKLSGSPRYDAMLKGLIE